MTNWSNFINRVCLLAKFFNKVYFLFYAYAFDGVIKFEYLKFDFLKIEKSFRSKLKITFPSLQVLSFGFKKQNNKNVMDTNFKEDLLASSNSL